MNVRKLAIAAGAAIAVAAAAAPIAASAQGQDMAGMGGPTGGTSNGWCQGAGGDLNNLTHANGPDHVCLVTGDDPPSNGHHTGN